MRAATVLAAEVGAAGTMAGGAAPVIDGALRRSVGSRLFCST
jgi:hypothetical protein